MITVPGGAVFGTLIIGALFQAAGGEEWKHFYCMLLILLPIYFLVMLFKRLRKRQNLLDEIYLGVVILTFIGGMIKGYPSQFADNYFYTPIFSGIACTLYPSVFFTMIQVFFTNTGFLKSIGNFVLRGISILTLLLLTVLPFSIISYIVPTYMMSRQSTNLLDLIVYYKNEEITELRKNWDYSSVEDCITQRLPVTIDYAIEFVKKEKPECFDSYGNVREEEKDEYLSGVRQYLARRNIKNDVGIYIYNVKYIGDSLFCIDILDEERAKHYCYQLDAITKEYSKMTFEQFDDAHAQYLN